MKKIVAPEPIKNPIVRFFTLGICSGLGLGFTPKAPGTAGSLLGIPLGLWLLKFPSWQAAIFCAVFLALASSLADRACRHWGNMDEQKIVIDEVLGQAITLLSLRHLSHPPGAMPSIVFIALGFGLFRLFDIFKPFPARTFDRQPSGFGVMADDVVAGLYGALVLWGIARVSA